jgi:hypothetical protein
VSTITALITALPKILALIQFITGMVRDAEQRGVGRQEAINEALTLAHRQLAEADAAELEANAAHAKHPDSDDAFDNEFKRPG